MSDPWAFGWTQLLTIVGFIITGTIAVGGFRSFDRWKREKLEERRMEIAFEALTIAYETNRTIGSIRNPASFSYEWEDMPRSKGDTDEQWRARAPFYVILKRVDKNSEFFDGVSRLQPRFMAMFGPETEAIFQSLYEARAYIVVSAQSMMRRVDDQREWKEADYIRSQEWEADIWGTVGDEVADRVGERVDKFRDELVKLCRPVVDRRYRMNNE